MDDPDLGSLMRAAAERQLAVTALQKKYAESESISTEQLVLDMRELLATERVVLDAIITLFVKLGHGNPRQGRTLPAYAAPVVAREPGASATDDNRPQFQAMVEAATARERPYDLVIVHSFSRFFRDQFEFERYRRKLAKAKGTLKMTGSYDRDSGAFSVKFSGKLTK